MTELAAVARVAALAPEALPGPELSAVAPVCAGLLLAAGHGLAAPRASVAGSAHTPGPRLHQRPAHAAVLTVAGIVTDVRISNALPVIA